MKRVKDSVLLVIKLMQNSFAMSVVHTLVKAALSFFYRSRCGCSLKQVQSTRATFCSLRRGGPCKVSGWSRFRDGFGLVVHYVKCTTSVSPKHAIIWTGIS